MKEETKEKLVGEGVGFERIRRITGYLIMVKEQKKEIE